MDKRDTRDKAIAAAGITALGAVIGLVGTVIVPRFGSTAPTPSTIVATTMPPPSGPVTLDSPTQTTLAMSRQLLISMRSAMAIRMMKWRRGLRPLPIRSSRTLSSCQPTGELS